MAVTLQQVIGRLMATWDRRGFAVLPPCGLEVPLGFQHPEAFFRLLDPEPWNAAFLQPIDRPADSRAGRHPFRTARHLQFQVLWQDPPAQGPRDAFAESLAVLGLDPAAHDLRFVDQILEVRALGVVGRGWRVELDGLGVGRVTFLEELGGHRLRRRTAELSFGVERLGMALTDATSVFTVPWRRDAAESAAEGGQRPAKRRETEEELYRYAVGVANVGHLRQIVDGFEREAHRCLAAGLPRAAYELAIRLLPALDRLETRGDLTPRERQQWLDQVRAVVEGAATLYMASESSQEAPARQPAKPPTGNVVDAATSAKAAAPSPDEAAAPVAGTAERADSEAATSPPGEAAAPAAEVNTTRKTRKTRRTPRPRKTGGVDQAREAETVHNADTPEVVPPVEAKPGKPTKKPRTRRKKKEPDG